jgi:DNA-3-methyladenine glycosylase I
MKCTDWCHKNALMETYHDTEWGVPILDDNRQFEFLILESFQAGLSWNLILQKRAVMKKALANFDVDRVAAMTDADVERILHTEGMIRSERKIRAAIGNARAFKAVQEEWGSFTQYIWHFTDDHMIIYEGHPEGHIPSSNGLSRRISEDLKKRGFKFLGPVTVYSHLQAAGLINDHDQSCPRFKEVQGRRPVAHWAADEER